MKEILRPIFDLILDSEFNSHEYSNKKIKLRIENPEDIDKCIDYIKGFSLRVLLKFLPISTLNIDIQEDSFTIVSNITEELLVYSAIEDKEVNLIIYLEPLYRAKLKSE